MSFKEVHISDKKGGKQARKKGTKYQKFRAGRARLEPRTVRLKIKWHTHLTRKLGKGSRQSVPYVPTFKSTIIKKGSEMDEKLFDLNRYEYVGYPMPRRQQVMVHEETAVEHGPGSFNITDRMTLSDPIWKERQH